MPRPHLLAQLSGAHVAGMHVAGALVTGALVLATALTVPVARAQDAAVPLVADGSVTITGHGFGHGHGLSQYGAQGAALAGLNAAQILAFYYPGTTAQTVSGRVSVGITNPSGVTQVESRPGLVARTVARPGASYTLASIRPHAQRWRLLTTPTGAELDYQISPTRPWRVAKRASGDLEFFAGGAPITLDLPSGPVAYRGTLRQTAGQTVNLLAVDSYVRGVVAREMPSGWSAAALQSQAVAARSYVAYVKAHPTGKPYQICDTTSCQVYGGVAAETAATNAAVAATAGQVLAYDGTPAVTQYSSSDGGWTAAGTVPYQVAQADPYDGWAGNAQHTWTTSVTTAAIATAWPAIGAPSSVDVLTRDGNGDWGGRVLSVQITGATGSVTVSGAAFRAALGLKSDWFTIAAATATATATPSS